jgi:plastocyanin
MKRTVLLAIACLLIACTSGTDRPPVSAEADIDTDGVQRIEVSMHSYYFEPSRIIVHAGKPVEIVLKNSSHIIPHGFTIADESLSVSEDKWGWGSTKVTFTPKKAGEYRFFCHKGDHEKNGMVGTLIVLP